MLMSGILATPDKRVRRVAVRKAALSSRVSLLSGTTTSSSGSSGSGSTITQESISRPRPRNPKENGGQRGKRQKPVSNAVSSKRKSSPRKGNGIIDVFAFLDKDASRSSLVPQRSKSGSSADRDDTKYAIQDDSDLDSDPRSLHSDSGISINDASSDHDSSKINGGFGKIPHNSQQHRIPGHHPTLYAERRHKPKLQPIPQHVDEDHPEYYYWPSDMRGRSVNPAVQDVETTAGPAEEQKSSGYDLLASSLCPSRDPSEASLPPLYRRFERLNHRILLQLQDEIAEMEEDLQLMDRADAAERAARHGHTAPASRRLDWQWRGNELHARRLALLGRIYLKVEQYNQALTSFQRVAQSTTPAPADDIETYRHWMSTHQPVVAAESSYLNQDRDLLSLARPLSSLSLSQSLSQSPSASASFLLLPTSPTQLTALMILVTAATALPILLFRLVPALTPRLAIVGLLVPFVACLPRARAPESFRCLEARFFLLVYLAVLLVAALVI